MATTGGAAPGAWAVGQPGATAAPPYAQPAYAAAVVPDGGATRGGSTQSNEGLQLLGALMLGIGWAAGAAVTFPLAIMYDPFPPTAPVYLGPSWSGMSFIPFVQWMSAFAASEQAQSTPILGLGVPLCAIQIAGFVIALIGTVSRRPVQSSGRIADGPRLAASPNGVGLVF